MIDWSKSTVDTKTLIAIMDKCEEFTGSWVERSSVMMDLTTADIAMDIDWDAMLEAGGYDMMHDVCGIVQHLDRKTGEIKNFFRPRFSK